MENKNLEIVIRESGLETVEGNSLMEKFGSYESIANEWEFKAKSIVVTDASQVTEMEMAKVAAKKFADLRIELEKARKAMKEQSLREQLSCKQKNAKLTRKQSKSDFSIKQQ